jgi:hypothetical protein
VCPDSTLFHCSSNQEGRNRYRGLSGFGPLFVAGSSGAPTRMHLALNFISYSRRERFLHNDDSCFIGVTAAERRSFLRLGVPSVSNSWTFVDC